MLKMWNAKLRKCKLGNVCKVRNKTRKHFISDTQSALVTDWFDIFPSHCTLCSFSAVGSLPIFNFTFSFHTLYVVNFALSHFIRPRWPTTCWPTFIGRVTRLWRLAPTVWGQVRSPGRPENRTFYSRFVRRAICTMRKLLERLIGKEYRSQDSTWPNQLKAAAYAPWRYDQALKPKLRQNRQIISAQRCYKAWQRNMHSTITWLSFAVVTVTDDFYQLSLSECQQLSVDQSECSVQGTCRVMASAH